MTSRRLLLPAALAVLLPARESGLPVTAASARRAPVRRISGRRDRRGSSRVRKDLSVLPTCGAFLPGGAR